MDSVCISTVWPSVMRERMETRWVMLCWCHQCLLSSIGALRAHEHLLALKNTLLRLIPVRIALSNLLLNNSLTHTFSHSHTLNRPLLSALRNIYCTQRTSFTHVIDSLVSLDLDLPVWSCCWRLCFFIVVVLLLIDILGFGGIWN